MGGAGHGDREAPQAPGAGKVRLVMRRPTSLMICANLPGLPVVLSDLDFAPDFREWNSVSSCFLDCGLVLPSIKMQEHVASPACGMRQIWGIGGGNVLHSFRFC